MHVYYTKNDTAFKERARAWGRANPKKLLANVVARQAKIRRATPAWADMKAITRFYADCPENHSVDHLIPINGRTVEGYKVSGLHVVWNLQYLPGVENYEKNNKMRAWEQAQCEGTAVDRSPRQLAMAL